MLLALRGSAVLGVADLWAALVSVADLWPSVRRFGVAASLVTGRAQTRAVALADLHVANVLGIPPTGIAPARFLGNPSTPTPLPLVLASSGHYVARALAPGRDEAEALDRGLARAVRITATETARAGTDAVAAIAQDRTEGWRRVTGPKPCPICAGLADGSINPWDDEEKISAHPHCSCVAEIVQ
ncbi:MAG: hypothetical protein WKF86_06010 [Acidimicrobiales bacterium]